MKDKFNKIMISIFVLGLFFVFAGSSYSLIDNVNHGAIDNADLSANLSISGTTSIKISKDTTEEDDSIRFTLINYENKKVSYTIYIKDNESAKNNCLSPCAIISNDHIKYELTKESTRFSTTTLSNDYIIDYGVIDGKSSINYNLKMWPYNNTEGTMYYGIIAVEGVISK